MRNLQPKLLVLALFVINSVQAQLKFPVNTAFQNDVQKVVAEFPNRFVSLMGTVLENNPQTVEYYSLVQVPDAESCTITRYSSDAKAIYSWQALMLRTEDFVEAAKKYH